MTFAIKMGNILSGKGLLLRNLFFFFWFWVLLVLGFVLKPWMFGSSEMSGFLDCFTSMSHISFDFVLKNPMSLCRGLQVHVFLDTLYIFFGTASKLLLRLLGRFALQRVGTAAMRNTVYIIYDKFLNI